MFCLTLGLGIAAILWYVCRWYFKQPVKEQRGGVRHKLKQTFSRFSQVDEELTMHQIDDHDEEILQTFSAPTQGEYNVQAVSAGVGGHGATSAVSDYVRLEEHSTGSPVLTRVTITSTPNKPYLETDI